MTTSALERSVDGAEPAAQLARVASQMLGKSHLSRARAAFEYFRVPDDDEEHRPLESGERKRGMMVP